MKPDDNPNPLKPSPAEIEKLLEIELMQKRASWQRAKAQRNIWRTLSFLFLFVIIVGALVGYFVFLSPSQLDEIKSGNLISESPSPTPE